MTMQTYTLVVEEMATAEGVSVDVYDEDGTIVDTEDIAYADYGLTADRTDAEAPEPIEQAVTADVDRLDLILERRGDEFEFRLLGDDEVLHSEYVEHADWGLSRADG